MANKTEFINRARTTAARFMAVLDEFRGLIAENTALDYGNPAVMVDADFTAADSNDDITAAQFQDGIDAVSDTLASMATAMDDKAIYCIRK